ncbi:hypothetical protein ACH4C6_36495 [Streptomyces sp. NPDC017943]|uniref:hypothetical protein n=1 Tax=Streptomyces sp. NPDC017943 TaxID=3365019 RepID=UPI0037974DF3
MVTVVLLVVLGKFVVAVVGSADGGAGTLVGAVGEDKETRAEAMDCRQLAATLGLEPVPAKVEGARSKAKRLAARGWLAEERPGLFSVPVGRGGGS